MPLGIVINRCVATTKARNVPIILINTTKQNVWIWQHLLATELFIADQIDEMEHMLAAYKINKPVGPQRCQSLDAEAHWL